MVDAGKIFLDIAFKNILVLATELCKPIGSLVLNFAFAAGIRITNKNFFIDRFQNSANGVVNNPISKRRSRNQPALGHGNVKIIVFTRLIAL